MEILTSTRHMWIGMKYAFQFQGPNGWHYYFTLCRVKKILYDLGMQGVGRFLGQATDKFSFNLNQKNLRPSTQLLLLRITNSTTSVSLVKSKLTNKAFIPDFFDLPLPLPVFVSVLAGMQLNLHCKRRWQKCRLPLWCFEISIALLFILC